MLAVAQRKLYLKMRKQGKSSIITKIFLMKQRLMNLRMFVLSVVRILANAKVKKKNFQKPSKMKLLLMILLKKQRVMLLKTKSPLMM